MVRVTGTIVPVVSVPPFLALPSGVAPVSVALDDVDIATLHAGPPDSTDRVLLVAGFTGSKEDFIALLPLLAAGGVHAVAYDQVGQYQSPSGADEARFSIDALADDVGTLARRVWPEGPRPHLVGHSLGGLVARRAVLRAPAEFTSLTLMSSGPGQVPASQRPPLETLRQVLPAASLADVWEAKRAIDAAKGLAEPPADIQAFLRRRWLASSPWGLRAKAGILLTEPDLTPDLAATGVPALVMFGGDDDVWSPAAQREVAAILDAPVVELPGVGHSPASDAPDAACRALLDFWSGRRRADVR